MKKQKAKRARKKVSNKIFKDLAGKRYALISGASSGIGEATAMDLAQRGYHLLLVARRLEKLKKLQSQLKEANPHLQIVIGKVDVQKPAQIDAFLKKHKKAIEGNIEILVNNAGLAKGMSLLQDSEITDWDVMIDTNVKGLLYLTKAALPYFCADAGKIVNLGSVAGRWVYKGGAVYCATKFAVRALSEGMRMDLMGTGIRVTNIEPGMVNTEFSLVRTGSQAKADSVYAGMKPLTASDIADTIGWAISRPHHVNIQEIVIFPTDQAAIGQVNRRS